VGTATATVAALRSYPLTIDDVEVMVAGVSTRWLDLDSKERRFTGKMSSTIRSSVARARVWSVPTILLARATGESLETTLKAAGTVALGGAAVGEVVTCYPHNVQRIDGPVDTLVRLEFELHEAVP